MIFLGFTGMELVDSEEKIRAKTHLAASRELLSTDTSTFKGLDMFMMFACIGHNVARTMHMHAILRT